MNEGILQKRILPENENPAITEKKFAAMWALLEGKLDIIHAKHRPTVIDFQGLPPGTKNKDLVAWVKKEIDIDLEDIEKNKNSPESILEYKILDYAYQQAKNFLRETLKYETKDINVKDPGSLSSKEDVLNLLNKVVPLTPEEGKKRNETTEEKRKRLHDARVYCRIIKVTVATYETFKNDAKLLKELTSDFENSLVSSPLESDDVNTPLVLKSEDVVGKKFYATDNYELEGTLASRAKDIDKLILKFIIRAESNAETALKDGIATRITIKKDQAIKLLPILYKWLTENKGATDVEVQNQSYLSKSQVEKFPKNIPLKTGKPNRSSMGKFETLKITGKLHSDSHGGQFEIQLVSSENKNEEGGMQHNIYDVVKLVSARTRLDGECPSSVFEGFVKDAHEASHPHIEISEIKKYLLEVDDAPIVIKKGKHGTVVYATSSTYERWKEFNWVDDSLFSEIESAKK